MWRGGGEALRAQIDTHCQTASLSETDEHQHLGDWDGLLHFGQKMSAVTSYEQK